VVTEVEKLKKNREERRAKQAEMKVEKESLMGVDPGNPNWEFINMIREYRATLDFRPIKETEMIEDHQITVCVRKRPLNKKGMFPMRESHFLLSFDYFRLFLCFTLLFSVLCIFVCFFAY